MRAATFILCFGVGLSLATSFTTAQTQPAANDPLANVAPGIDKNQLPVVTAQSLTDVMQIRLDNEQLVIRTPLPETPTQSKLEIPGYGGFTTLLVQGKAGDDPNAGAVEARNFQFDHWDFSTPGMKVQTSVASTAGHVNIARFTQATMWESSVQVIQSPFPGAGENAVSLTVQKTVSATDRIVVDLHLSSASIVQLRREHPRETAEYLEPIFRDLHQEAGVFSIDPKVAWQVFADAYTPDERDRATVKKLVAKLDADNFRDRQKASEALRAMGEPAAMILRTIDRSKLSAEQISRIDALLNTFLPLIPADAKRLRDKPDFLLDCLYTPDPFVRAQAVARLEHLTGRKIEIDPSLEGEARVQAIDRIRALLNPPKYATAPTTAPAGAPAE